MARQRRRKKGSSYQSKTYFRGVKSSAEDGSRSRVRKNGNGFLSSIGHRIGGFLIIAVLLTGILLLGYVDRASVNVNGPSPYEESSLETRVQAYLDSNPVRRLKPFITSSGLLDFVKETHPDVASTSIAMTAFSPSIEVEIDMRSPALIWVNANSTQDVVDVSGVVYADFDPEFHSDLSIKVSDATQPAIELGKQALSPQLVAFITNINSEIQNQTKISSSTYELPLAARELVLKLPEYDIRFSLDRFEQEQVLELKLLLLDLEKRSITPSQYIDLRAEDRAFYK